MPSPTTSIRDAEEWVAKLRTYMKEKGMKNFLFKDLPAELHVKSLHHKASSLNLIERVDKTKYLVGIWRLR